MRRRHEWILPTLESLLGPEALRRLAEQGESVWTAAVTGGLVEEEVLLRALAARAHVPGADWDARSPAAATLLPEATARKYGVAPLHLREGILTVATADPGDLDCERALGFAAGRGVRFALASPRDIAHQLDLIYRAPGAAAHEDGPLDARQDQPASIVGLVDAIIHHAITDRASDIHLEIQEHRVEVVHRVDGILRQARTLPKSTGMPLVSRIKIMSGLDIADRLRPQDGRARVQHGAQRVDLRVSTLPAATGEKVVIRVLHSGATALTLDALGVGAADRERVERLAALREGLVLVTGPTGSGKTTTLYAMLRAIQQRGVNIVTVEDPIEYRLSGVVQVQVNERAGLTFASALRSILRQDPDVVLVGEIRDQETAAIAIQAALTGHLVLSTLHTIDALSSVARLQDLGVESYKVGAALKGVVAQRLLRRLCEACKARVLTPPLLAQAWVPGEVPLFAARGCSQCGSTGYRGRIAVAEILIVSSELERHIGLGDSVDTLAAVAKREGHQPLWDIGLASAMRGATDFDELVRVIELPPERPDRPSTTSLVVHESAASDGDGPFALEPWLPEAPSGECTSVLVADREVDRCRAVVDALLAAGLRAVGLPGGLEVLTLAEHARAVVVALEDPDAPLLLDRLRRDSARVRIVGLGATSSWRCWLNAAIYPRTPDGVSQMIRSLMPFTATHYVPEHGSTAVDAPVLPLAETRVGHA